MQKTSSRLEQLRRLLDRGVGNAPGGAGREQIRQWIVHFNVEHLHGPEEIHYGADELVVLTLVKDGRPYVRSFVEHYTALGVKHIIILDNGSTDGTVEAARKHDNVTVLRSTLPFKEYQLPMKRYLIRRFGYQRWSLFVDMDELFDYPYSDVASLSSLLNYLGKKNYTAVVAQMLDMFSARPLKSIASIDEEFSGDEDEPLKESHRFYDISSIRYTDYYPSGGENNVLGNDEIQWLRDGIKTILFGHRAVLSKHPLVFFDGNVWPMDTTAHRVNNAHVADFTGALYHFKLLDRLHKLSVRAVEEKNYPNRHQKYEKYVRVLKESPELQIKRETARELKSVNDLVENQFLVVSGDYMAFVDTEEEKRIVHAAEGEPRRFADVYFKTKAAAQTARARRLERQVAELQRILRKERKEIRPLQSRVKNLEAQLQGLQASRGWRLLSTLSRIRASILRR